MKALMASLTPSLQVMSAQTHGENNCLIDCARCQMRLSLSLCIIQTLLPPRCTSFDRRKDSIMQALAAEELIFPARTDYRAEICCEIRETTALAITTTCSFSLTKTTWMRSVKPSVSEISGTRLLRLSAWQSR
jgi:hypothetical protein